MIGNLDRPAVWLPGIGQPPLLMLHDDEQDLVPLAAHLRPRSPVLSPRGTVLQAGAPRFFKRIREGMFDERDLGERAEDLADFVLDAGDAYQIKAGRFVAVGYCNGASIASAMMMGGPEVLAGAVLIAAVPPYRRLLIDADLTGRWVVIVNGRHDPNITARQTAVLVRQFREMGAQVQLLQHNGGHVVPTQLLPQIGQLIASHSTP